jgi:Ion channel
MSRAPRDAGRLSRAYARRRYTILFYMLLLTLGAAPLLVALGFSTDALQILLAFSLLAVLLGVPAQRWRAVLMVLAAIAVGIRLAPIGGHAAGPLVAVSVIALLAAGSALLFAMRTTVVDAEHVYAALSVYLLAGLIFGVLHWAMESAWPGSLVEAGRDASAQGLPLSTAIYYSFVTLATLGYGDVVPKSELARGIAVLEAVGGQLYVAVLVARLVGAHLQTPSPRPRA